MMAVAGSGHCATLSCRQVKFSETEFPTRLKFLATRVASSTRLCTLVWFEACVNVMEVSVLQIISVLGALAILGAYIANQFRLIGPSNMSYSVMNFIGSAVLAVIAVIEVQWGFILLEGVWALVSLWGIITLLRGGTPRGAH
jgi:hypothetical protein